LSGKRRTALFEQKLQYAYYHRRTVRTFGSTSKRGNKNGKKKNRDPTVHTGTFESESEKVLRRYVQRAQCAVNSRGKISRHYTVPCHVIDDAQISAETLFNDLVFSRVLTIRHCTLMASICYDSGRFEEIKHCMRLCRIQPNCDMYLQELKMLRVEHTPEYKILGVVAEMRSNEIWSSEVDKVLAWGPKELRRERERRLSLWINGGTQSRESAWRLFRRLMETEQRAAHTTLFRIMSKYGCSSAQSIRANILAPSQRLGYERPMLQATIYEALEYQHSLEADPISAKNASKNEMELLAKEGMRPRKFNADVSGDSMPLARKTTHVGVPNARVPRVDHHRKLLLRRLLHRDFREAWVLFCTLEVKRAIRPEFCTLMVSACFSEDEIQRRIAQPAHALGLNLGAAFDAASIEQHLLLGDFRSASTCAERLRSRTQRGDGGGKDDVDSILRRAKSGTLSVDGFTFGGNVPIRQRRINAVQRWSNCGGEAGRNAVAQLFGRLIDDEDRCKWLYEHVVDRMIAEGSWAYAEEIFDAGAARDVFRKANVSKITGNTDDEVVVDLSGLSRGCALVVLRRHIVEGTSALKILTLNSSESATAELAKQEALARMPDASKSTDAALSQVVDVLLQHGRVRLSDLQTFVYASVVEEHGSFRSMLEKCPGLFRMSPPSPSEVDAQWSVSLFTSKEAALDASFVRTLTSVVALSDGGSLRGSQIESRLKETDPEACALLERVKEQTGKSLKSLVQELRGFDVSSTKSSQPGDFSVSLSRRERPGVSIGQNVPVNTDTASREIFRARGERWKMLRISVISALRQFGVAKFKETENGRVIRIGKRALERVRGTATEVSRRG